MNSVFVIGSTQKPLMSCRPARARKLLSAGRAAVYRLHPFTIILNDRADGETQPIEVKIDPGSKTTGIALVAHFEQQGAVVLFGANLNHRGQAIKNNLESRRSLRRGRRGRKTRYRQARFLNRTRKAGWLPPSVESRVVNTESILHKLASRCPITSASVELVKFDTQAMVNPEISGAEYQQGQLAGYEVREYLLEKWHRTCVYCGAQNVPLQVEHIHPKARGGSDRVSNLTLACGPCNQKKGSQPIDEFLKGKSDVLRKIKAQARAPLKDAAAVNTTRKTLVARLQARWPVTTGSGGRTKYNRTQQGYPKDHWIDAACVGETGERVNIPEGMKPLTITAKGRGSHQVVRTDRYGFPRGKAGRIKRVRGFSTGDLVKLVMTKGKYAGTYLARLAGIRSTGILDIKTAAGTVGASWKNFQLIQRNDGFDYATKMDETTCSHCKCFRDERNYSLDWQKQV
jgi:5-methylcytosine-specific restriction endonuclease McrA